MRTSAKLAVLVVISAILVACGSADTQQPTEVPVSEQEPTEAENTATPTETPVPSVTPAPTDTLVPTQTPVPTETAVPTETIVKPLPLPNTTPSSVPRDAPTLGPTTKPLPLPTAISSSVPKDTPTLGPANKLLPLPTDIPSSAPTDTRTLGRTKKPIPSSTATPYSTPTPTEWNESSGWNGEACSMPNHSIHITTDGSVLFNSSSDVAGFQFTVDGATVVSASGGESESQGFTISASDTIVLGFSLAGATFTGCGTMVELSLHGEAIGLSSIIISDPSGDALPLEYFG